MKDYEYLFVTSLHSKLKDKINGKIHVKVQHNKLYVEIERLGLIYSDVVVEDFSEKVLHGYTSDYAAYEIIRDFKIFIKTRFFY